MLAAHITAHLQSMTVLVEVWRLFEEGWRNKVKKKLKHHKILVIANCSEEMWAVFVR